MVEIKFGIFTSEKIYKLMMKSVDCVLDCAHWSLKLIKFVQITARSLDLFFFRETEKLDDVCIGLGLALHTAIAALQRLCSCRFICSLQCFGRSHNGWSVEGNRELVGPGGAWRAVAADH